MWDKIEIKKQINNKFNSTISQFHHKPQFNSWAAHHDPKKNVNQNQYCK